MADIFISYAREDREAVHRLAAALEGAGYSVWWDQHVLAGSEFSEEIERELKSAKAVIVAWSVNGVKSRWVKDEAVIAQDASKIVPVTLDGTESPIGFRQVHMIDLKDWKGATDAAPFATLKDSIATKVGAHAIPAAAAPKPGFRISVRPLVAGGALLVLAIGIVGGLFLRPWHNPSKAAAPPPAAAEAEVAPNAQDASIAVLAFNNMSGDKDNEYFSDGISEELLNDLAQVPGLHVAARTSSFSFKGKNASIADIAKALNVRAVLEGSVRRAGTRVRITAQLINAADGYHMWSQDYDREIADIFAVQDEIAKAITRELTGKLLAPSGISAAGKPKINPEAYTAILQGRFFMAKRNKPDMLRAVDFFKQAIALEPNYVDAHAGLGQTYARLYTNGQSRTALQPAKDATATALRLDPDNVQALTTQITIAVGEWDWQEAELGLRQVMKISPNDADVRHQNAVRFFYLNLPEAALMEERRAAALDPLAPILRQNIGDDLHWLNRNAEAAIEYRAALTLDPNFVFALNGLCIAEADLGNLDTAKEILHNRLIAVDGEDGSATGSCRAAIALRGDDVQELKRLSSVASRQYANGDVPASSVALIYLYAGDLDEGLHWLAMAYNERDSYIFFTLTDPDLPAKLKADPRWKAFMQRPLMKEWQAAHDRAAAALAAETGAGGSGSH